MSSTPETAKALGPLSRRLATYMSTLAVPPRASRSSDVSLWSRYGTWRRRPATASITELSAVSDLLIWIA